jgi:hypothetical protein
MFKTKYALVARFSMEEFTGKHTVVCRRLFKTRDEAFENGPAYIKEVVAKFDLAVREGKSIFSLIEKDATYHVLEMDDEID